MNRWLKSTINQERMLFKEGVEAEAAVALKGVSL